MGGRADLGQKLHVGDALLALRAGDEVLEELGEAGSGLGVGEDHLDDPGLEEVGQKPVAFSVVEGGVELERRAIGVVYRVLAHGGGLRVAVHSEG